METETQAQDPYTRSYSLVILDHLGTCSICQKKIAYFNDVTVHNYADEHHDIVQATVSFVCAWNKNGYHIIGRPKFNDDNPAVIQQIVRLYYHPDTPWRNFHELLPTEAA